LVAAGNGGLGDQIFKTEAEANREAELMAARSKSKAEAWQREQAAQAAKKREPTEQFLAGLKPAQAAKAREALERGMGFRGEVHPRAKIIATLLGEGHALSTDKTGKRRLTSPAGTFFSEADLTKTAMDYAEFLLSQK
jgi:hypothetical protein